MSNIKKLADILLENVASGDDDNTNAAAALVLAAPLTTIGVFGALGCSIAQHLCQKKATQHMLQRNESESEYYQGVAGDLGVATMVFTGLAATSITAGAIYANTASEN